MKQVEPETPRVPLALRDAVEKGLQNGLALEVQRYGPYIANEVLASAWGAYDPELYSDYQYSSTDTPRGKPPYLPELKHSRARFYGGGGAARNPPLLGNELRGHLRGPPGANHRPALPPVA